MLSLALRSALLLALTITGSLRAQETLRIPRDLRQAPSGDLLFRLVDDQESQAYRWTPDSSTPEHILTEHNDIRQLEWWPDADTALLALVHDGGSRHRALRVDLTSGETTVLPLPSTTRRLVVQPGSSRILFLEETGATRSLGIHDLGSDSVRPTKVDGLGLEIAIDASGDRAWIARPGEGHSEIFELALETASVRELGRFTGHCERFAFSPDGTAVAFIGSTPSDAGRGRLYRWASGVSAPRRVAEELTVARGPDLAPPSWAPDSKSVFMEVIASARSQWSRVTLDTGKVQRLSPREFDATTGTGTADRWSLVVSTELLPPEIAILDAQGQVAALTDFNEPELLGLSTEVLEAFVTRHQKTNALLFVPTESERPDSLPLDPVLLLHDRGRGALTREFDPIVHRLVRAGQAVLVTAPGGEEAFARRYRSVGPFVSQLARRRQIASENLALISVGSETAFGLWLSLHTRQFVAVALVARSRQLGGHESSEAFGDVAERSQAPGFFPRIFASRTITSVLWVSPDEADSTRVGPISKQLADARFPSTAMLLDSPSTTWPTLLDWLETRREQDGLAASEPASLSQFTDDVRSSALNRARNDMLVLQRGVQRYVRDFGFLPRTMRSLLPLPSDARGYVDFRELPRDPWGRQFVLRGTVEDFEILSFGADGRLGGLGDEADLTTRDFR